MIVQLEVVLTVYVKQTVYNVFIFQPRLLCVCVCQRVRKPFPSPIQTNIMEQSGSTLII